MKYINESTEEVKKNRKPNYDIAPQILNRWSPRALEPTPLSDEELYPLFEAARWAPSTFNSQPWRFIITRRENKKDFEKLFNVLYEGNQIWTKNAAALVLIITRKNFEYNDKPSASANFDTGAAWENLAIEATRRGLVAHAMSGFDFDKAREVIKVPDEFEINAMIAIGKRGNKEDLPEKVQEAESPNDRRPLSEIIFDGEFGKEINFK